jgi:hypothetical protein
MTELLRFDSENGAVWVEVAESTQAPVTRGGKTGSLVVEAGESLDGVLSRIGPLVKGVVRDLRATADWPDDVEVEFSVKLSADSNIIIARAGGEANFRIKLKWSGSRGDGV